MCIAQLYFCSVVIALMFIFHLNPPFCIAVLYQSEHLNICNTVLHLAVFSFGTVLLSCYLYVSFVCLARANILSDYLMMCVLGTSSARLTAN